MMNSQATLVPANDGPSQVNPAPASGSSSKHVPAIAREFEFLNLINSQFLMTVCSKKGMGSKYIRKHDL